MRRNGRDEGMMSLPLLRGARRAARVLRDASDHFVAHRAGTAAWAIAFRSLLCLIPLLLLVGSVAGFIVGSSEEALTEITDTLAAALPTPAASIKQGLQALMVLVAGRAASGFLGLVGLFWMASGVFNLLYDSFNQAAGVRRGYVRSRLVGLATCLFVTLLLAIGFGVTSLGAILGFSINHRTIAFLGLGVEATRVLRGILGLILAGLGFAALYKFVPARRAGFRWAIIAGLGMGLIWGLTRWGFSAYVGQQAIYSKVYGPLAGVFIAAFWAYVTAVLLLYGAELTFALDRSSALGFRSSEFGILDHEEREARDEKRNRETYDLTFPLDENTPAWPTRSPFQRRLVRSMAEGHHCDTSAIATDSHFGTHIDAPAHFIRGGATIDQLPGDLWWGPCRVLDLRGRSSISAKDLAAADLAGCERIAFLTDNTHRWAGEGRFFEDFVYLEPDAAQVLADLGVRLVGTDGLSIDPYKAPGDPAHTILLGAGAAVIEGLNLRGVPPGDYELAALPLRIRGTEASPARVLLRPG